LHFLGNRILTDESDNDILILTPGPVDRSLKKQIHDAVFPLSVQVGAFISVLTVQESEWNNSPEYYSLRQNITGEMQEV
jgi:hypothetical protein